ncbi:MAG: sigma 54-interacting transcriptional regulator [Acidobacteria bacterium]|jgi:DNA-binding NtrC family response regulator/pSer/pThr/pTyr-binding forkhead associated (FHA) protein|nr:sigma 54-interacting transcriptional regulator [Acidobacteriota bacterium]MCU0253301.1 sigma 54-interacting transcriptional regulator [Acidobacteriota bacterium]
MSTLWLVGTADRVVSGEAIDLLDRQVRAIGRSHSCDVQLSDPRVSARHAEVRWNGEQIVVRDLSSRNGTWLDRRATLRRIDPGESVALEPGDRVLIGPYRLVPASVLDQAIWLDEEDPVGATLADTSSPVGTLRPPPLVLDALERLAAAGTGREFFSAVLAELTTLAGAERGYLVTLTGERWVLRGSHGVSGPVCLSRSFLEAARERDEAWSASAASVDRVHAEEKTALDQYAPGTVLTAVPLRGASPEFVAIAYLEGTAVPDGMMLTAATRFGAVSGLLVEGALSLDRERRRREAAERLVRRARGASDAPAGIEPALIGDDPAFRAAVDAVRRAAASRATILLRGPSGTGKEELARLAHRAGPRREHPFVALNGAALPEGLVEAELFGADRGAYTGAERTRAGAFEHADGGTLFLDEIGDLPLPAQAKILRAIETGELTRVGGSRCRVDVRLVAATHRPLETMVAEGTFREDLYYRLRVIEILLPSLRERPGDIVPLANHFLEQFLRPDGQRVGALSAAAIRVLTAYSWPGNVRELRNVLERAVVLDRDGVVDLDDLPGDLVPSPSAAAQHGSWAELLALPWREAHTRFEAHYFRSALESHQGRVREAAEATGLDRRTLSTKIREHRLRAKKP